ncbi:ADP-glyceromanno-heptose 6-epimerase [Acidiphilium sp. PA]|uniref:ADP-glyceromanno-heptose 6-epimerase n=1 Tax=Acidiphilium sp. PA TaxID=2871705 RepID=UPI002242F400|nr:ADP-glyceromanno-heptose 6-epimerase [Acidiphilium sp. PA]MCW8308342.1 ADP-glyceromanno-heptose 6-epimerase [Acidiphilium sp. PA]
MILVTGGAGFIGSNLHAELNQRMADVVIVDELGHFGKWRNLHKHPPSEIIHPSDLTDYLATHPPIEVVVHLGAVSETTATDGDLVWRTNVTLSQELWHWCADRGVRFIYASSASTYGDGSAGFDDTPTIEALERLRPLNLYGWSKHAFDLWVAREVAAGRNRPPQWAGLKFFNVYGPNEYHKGPMVSVVKVKHDQIRAGDSITLFRSDQIGIADGEQARDFIWIDDVIAGLTFLLDHPAVNGLFNLGTGTARSYADLARAVCAAHGVATEIVFVPMPDRLIGQYQSFTQASVDRFRAAGFDATFTSLEDGVARYVTNFLNQPDPYR